MKVTRKANRTTTPIIAHRNCFGTLYLTINSVSLLSNLGKMQPNFSECFGFYLCRVYCITEHSFNIFDNFMDWSPKYQLLHLLSICLKPSSNVSLIKKTFPKIDEFSIQLFISEFVTYSIIICWIDSVNCSFERNPSTACFTEVQ